MALSTSPGKDEAKPAGSICTVFVGNARPAKAPKRLGKWQMFGYNCGLPKEVLAPPEWVCREYRK